MAIPSVGLSNDHTRLLKNAEHSPVVENRKSVDMQILKSVDLSQVSAKDQPMQLLYRAAVSKINEQLESAYGPDALEGAVESGIDVSPEATAERIVSLSTGFLEAFKVQHKGEDEAEVLEKFMDTIGRGIEQGFAEAREILEGLQVLQGDIASNIDRTYELVQDGLAAFKQQQQSDTT